MQTKKLKRFYFEILLVVTGHFLYGACMKTTDVVIRNDGKGYYDYLPAAFIYHDLNFGFRNQPMPFAENNTSHSIEHNGKIINKYPCGPAILWAPFFIVTHEWLKSSTVVPHNGYSLPYHFAVYLAALFYLLAGLIYLRKLLLLYTDNLVLVRCIQLILLFATNLYSYAYFESSFTHVYSFSLIVMFFYAFLQWNKTKRNKYLFLTAVLLGLIVLVRPFNILVLLFLPFFGGGIRPFYETIKQAYTSSITSLLLAVITFLCIAAIQPILWFVQCGTFFPWTYTEETFFFGEPALWQTLFSFKKGLFIYTPVLILSLVAPVILFVQKKKTAALTLFLALVVLHYFISSWQMWWYGGSFGSRPYVDYYSIFAVMALIALESVKRWMKLPVFAFVFLCLGLNLIQTYQYTHNILPPAEMDFQGYKDIFLKTDTRYGGVLAYRYHSREMMKYPLLKEIKTEVKDSLYKPGEWRQLAVMPLAHTQGEWIRLNTRIKLDCANVNEQYLCCHVLDSAQQTLHYEQIPIITLSENKQNIQTLNYCVSYKPYRSCYATIHIGFSQLRKPRKVYSVTMQLFGERQK